MSSPQQTSVPPPTLSTVTSLPQTLHRYFSPTCSTAMLPSFLARSWRHWTHRPVMLPCPLMTRDLPAPAVSHVLVSTIAACSQSQVQALYHSPTPGRARPRRPRVAFIVVIVAIFHKSPLGLMSHDAQCRLDDFGRSARGCSLPSSTTSQGVFASAGIRVQLAAQCRPMVPLVQHQYLPIVRIDGDLRTIPKAQSPGYRDDRRYPVLAGDDSAV